MTNDHPGCVQPLAELAKVKAQLESELIRQAKLRHAALFAYRVLAADIDSYDADSGPPPNDLLTAHNLLFEALELYQAPSEDNGDELPF